MEASKKCKNSLVSKDFYFTMVEWIRRTGTLPKHLGSRQKINYWVQRGKRQGDLIKKGLGVWEVKTPLELCKNSLVVGTPKPIKNIRGHGYIFGVKIRPTKWNIEHLKLDSKIIPSGYRINFRNHKVWLCHESLVIYFNDNTEFMGASAQESQAQAIYAVNQLLIGLEYALNESFNYQGKFRVKIIRQHYAEVGNELAIDYMQKKEVLKVIGQDKKEWLLIDCSTGIPELETVHSQLSPSDMVKIQTTFNDLRDYPEPIKISEIISILGVYGQMLGLDYSLGKLKPTKEKQLSLRDNYFG